MAAPVQGRALGGGLAWKGDCPGYLLWKELTECVLWCVLASEALGSCVVLEPGVAGAGAWAPVRGKEHARWRPRGLACRFSSWAARPRWEAVTGGSLLAWPSEAMLHAFLHMDCSTVGTVGLCVGSHSLLV